MNILSPEMYLNNLGLDEKESRIYLYITQYPGHTVQKIARATSINRTTVYRYLQSLVQKNLAEWIIGTRGKMVRAAPPGNLEMFLVQQKQKISSLETALPQMINNLRLFTPNEKFETQVRYYKGEEGIKQMIWNTLKTTETVRSYAPVGKRREVIDKKFEDLFEKEWSLRGLKDRVITNETRLKLIPERLVRNYIKTLQIRIIPAKKFYINNDITIYNNIVAIASLEKGNLVGVEIENEEIAKTQKSIFKIIWDVGKPYKMPDLSLNGTVPRENISKNKGRNRKRRSARF